MASEEEEEREFLAQLKARSGRDLAGWMAAITAQGFADKNHAIDWLRAQGFPFARASWLERIHNNGGKPIYLDRPQVSRADGPRPAPRGPATPAPPQSAPPRSAALETLLAASKGYRPLYQLLEAEIRKVLPRVGIAAASGYVSLCHEHREFAAVTLHASELRLFLDLGARPFDAPLKKAKLKGTRGSLSHMLVLTDARQVDEELMRLIRSASERAQGGSRHGANTT